MKKFKRMLAGLACVLAVCLCTPTAFAAKVIVYFDANGGTCTSAAERTNADGQLTSLPTATMEGYTFDGWYTTGTDDVTGFPIDVQVKANDTAFGADTTVYAHWFANGGSAEVVEEKEVDPTPFLQRWGWRPEAWFWCCWQAWHFERSGHAAELKISGAVHRHSC